MTVGQRQRPPQLKSEDMDRLARQNAQLMTELWIVKDRLTLLESMLETAGLLDRGALNRLKPEGRLAAELAAERDAYVARMVDDDIHTRNVDKLKKRANPYAP